MKRLLKTLDIIDKVFQYALIFLSILFAFLAFAEVFGKQLCENESTCYAIIAFLGGIIITLKIKVLENRKNIFEFIFLVVGLVANILLLVIAYVNGCKTDSEESVKAALLLLNATIWLDFIIFIRNTYIVIVTLGKEMHSSWKNKKEDTELAKKDLFVYWLKKKEKNKNVKLALTDKSCKKIDTSLTDEETNVNLATYGDAIIKQCLTGILYEKSIVDITKERSIYESDEYFVKKVAKHYDLLKYIKKDPGDSKMAKDYEYSKSRNGNSPYKYIATAVEAMIGAIYIETNDMEPIKKLVNSWRLLEYSDDEN